MKSPIVWGKGIIVGAVRLGLPADLDHARWCEIGANLSQLERAVAWWVGDWWAFGEHRHGARREITEDPGWRGPAYQTCANAAAICRAFEISRRRETLSFSHHAAVAALAPAEQDRLLDRAEREGWSRQQLRDAVRSIEAPAGRSIAVLTTKAVERITVPRVSEVSEVSEAASPPIRDVASPAIPDQPPLTKSDMTEDPAREAECDLAHFLERFENSYGAIREFAPVIERMREAQAMLSGLVLRQYK